MNNQQLIHRLNRASGQINAIKQAIEKEEDEKAIFEAIKSYQGNSYPKNMWVCSKCTLNNLDTSSHCSACENPKLISNSVENSIEAAETNNNNQKQKA